MPNRPEIVRCSGATPCTYRVLFDAVEDIIYIRDLAGVILDINEAGVRFFGKPKEKIVGKTFHTTAVDERAMSLLETNLSLLESGKDRSIVELVNDKGERVPFEVTTAVVRDRQGAAVGAFGVMRDVRPLATRAAVPFAATIRLPSSSFPALPASKDLTDSALFSGGVDIDSPAPGGWDPDKG